MQVITGEKTQVSVDDRGDELVITAATPRSCWMYVALVVVVMVDRRAPGNALLSSLALLTLAAFALAIRALSAPAGERSRP